MGRKVILCASTLNQWQTETIHKKSCPLQSVYAILRAGCARTIQKCDSTENLIVATPCNFDATYPHILQKIFTAPCNTV